MASKKIKLFEAHLGDKFYAWKADDRTAIRRGTRQVIVVQQHEEYGEVVTYFDLDQVSAYTIA